jgi:CubicO group peptidase (beta-lactamase class C family)
MNNPNLTIIFLLILFQSCSSMMYQEAQVQEFFGNSPSSEFIQTINPAAAGWNPEFLSKALDYARDNGTSGILILNGGYVITEEYWSQPAEKTSYEGFKTATFDGRPMEDIASMQKSIISLLIGIACDKGLISKQSPVNEYLSPGWSKAPAEIENTITINHLLSMNSGLGNNLDFRGNPGEIWQYNTAAYNMLMKVMNEVTGKSLQEITQEWLFQPLKITDSFWIRRPDSLGRFPNRFIATHRDLAKIAYLILSDGNWNNLQIYRPDGCMVSAFLPSQDINNQYGHLFWLNTKQERNPFAPADLIEMVGAKERFVTIIPSQDIIVVRLGETPEENFHLKFWSLLQKAMPTSDDDISKDIPVKPFIKN